MEDFDDIIKAMKKDREFLHTKNLRARADGFTLIEILVVAAVGAILTTGGFVMFSGYQRSQNVKATLSEITASIRDTQKRSVTQQNGKQWGMRISNGTTDSFQTWSGLSYASGTMDQTYGLRRNIQFGNPPTGFNFDLIFQAMSGVLGEDRILTINTGAGALVGDVIVNTLGKVTTRLENGLIGYWHFDEGTSTIAYDASGNGNNGTLTNGPAWQTGTNCKAGGCIDFDGINDYIQLGTLSSYANAVTVSAWVFHNTASGWDDIVAGGCGNILFGFSNNYLSFGGQCNSPFGMTTYVSNINSAWHHVAGVFNGTTATVYIDGMAVASSTKSGAFSVFTPRIGGEGTSENFYGKIDEVRIYNRALSAQEVLNIYNDLK